MGPKHAAWHVHDWNASTPCAAFQPSSLTEFFPVPQRTKASTLGVASGCCHRLITQFISAWNCICSANYYHNHRQTFQLRVVWCRRCSTSSFEGYHPACVNLLAILIHSSHLSQSSERMHRLHRCVSCQYCSYNSHLSQSSERMHRLYGCVKYQ